ncbi:AraC family transcriptional regulator of adaptative response/methylated-DNA-[protein]-cysteine methyltransferase [Chitinophaga niastensis]|uniref:Methylated-DNA--protein-cysteine methyltransferase n=1 Tax=Chitinophaga niastensis TaxID=536980 RepID=A0A2P8HPS1_CHINA|nr:methylated-DNA--[protein]-cysteine S-methyltransferase [Chitinophaga niastensis]PSL48202.1 AraC family transcriptional regulator of adaptative response/methylated-DNA-[protein]-cysteine methyltransferase [Chitinophaga niastensis]
MLTNEIMYKALVEKDVAYEGTFVAAVKTTGIFCRPTCTARKPKEENVEFFKTTREAILKGYRPCKVCNPLEKLGETPDFIKAILNELNINPSAKFKDGDLMEKGIEPSKIRRWFLKNHGITFHAYQRMFRINSAFKKIQQGETITAVAFDSGYESLSGFTDSFKSVFGVSPSNSKDKQIINITRLETPLGTMFACAVEQGICLLEFTDRKMLETELKALAKQLNANIIQGANKHFELLKRELDEYFEGKRKVFTVPLFAPGTVFQQSVWKTLQTIPYGATHSYKQQSIAMNKREAVRAVANANGMNRISIIIPCHRVIGEDGNLTGYGGGLLRKKWLLDLEQSNL